MVVFLALFSDDILLVEEGIFDVIAFVRKKSCDDVFIGVLNRFQYGRDSGIMTYSLMLCAYFAVGNNED